MGEARYKQLAAKLRAAIEAGEYPPDSVLPHQEQIAADEGVSLKTVRAAVNLLATEGLVTPVRRRGTVVRSRPVPVRMSDPRRGGSGWSAFRRTAPEWPHSAPGSGSDHPEWSSQPSIPRGGVTKSVIYADGAVAAALGVPSGEPVTTWCFALRDDEILTRTQTSYVKTDLLDDVGEDLEFFDDGAFLGTLPVLRERGVEVGEVVEVLTARAPSVAERRDLAMPDGEPVVEVRRTALRVDGSPLEYAVTIFRGAYFEWELVSTAQD